MIESRQVQAVVEKFRVAGTCRSTQPLGNGHINDTQLVVLEDSGAETRCVLQRINRHIFQQPEAMMDNIRRVTTHLAARTSGEPDACRRCLTLIPARDGRCFHQDVTGDIWRMYDHIPGGCSMEVVGSTAEAFEAAKAVGRFQRLLADLPSPRLHETLPDFHHTPKRFAALEQAVAIDGAGRGCHARAEIEFAFARRSLTGALLAAGLPERIVHNDTKLNNLLFDADSGEALCVVDLDTVMPGLAPLDFGDLVRTAACPAREDERDLSQVELQIDWFEALARGYLSEAGQFLTVAEKAHLVCAGKLITLETGIRFLTDYLSGDTYFKVQREGQNLDRCRTQFKLVASIERQEPAMQRLIDITP